MTMDDMSAERSAAYYKLREAEQEAHKGHLEKALGLARDALQEDPTYLEARFWIAAQYEAMDELRKASHEYQDIIHGDHENEEAWARLRAIDPDAAGRMERLQQIAPDPFVVQREHPEDLDEDLDDLSSLAAERAAEAEEEEIVPRHEGEQVGFDSLEEIEGTDGVQALIEGLPEDRPAATTELEELDALDEEEDEEADWSLEAAGEAEEQGEEEEGPVSEDASTVELLDDGVEALYDEEIPQAAGEAEAAEDESEPEFAAAAVAVEEEVSETPPLAAPPAAASPPWLHEEDLKYRQKLESVEQIGRLLPKLIEHWEDTDTWETSIGSTAHLDKERHHEVVEVCREVAAQLGTTPWMLYVSPERRLYSTITRGDPPTLVITTGTLNNLNRNEQKFLLGRLTGFLAAGHLPYLEAVILVLERSPLSITDVESDVLELIKHAQAGWDVGVNRDSRLKLGALCHAWQLRAELSADRAGYVCCGDLETSLNVIARSVTKDPSQMKSVTWRSLLEKYQGQDLAKLADIPPKEDPIRNEGYGVYRIQMLRWWATTATARELLKQG
jgi:tetratricopeptide (TPR) repeat protein